MTYKFLSIAVVASLVEDYIIFIFLCRGKKMVLITAMNSRSIRQRGVSSYGLFLAVFVSALYSFCERIVGPTVVVNPTTTTTETAISSSDGALFADKQQQQHSSPANNEKQHHHDDDDDEVKVAWFLSFGGSVSTGYVIGLRQRVCHGSRTVTRKTSWMRELHRFHSTYTLFLLLEQGTSYSINNIEGMTETTTATNYGRDLPKPLMPVRTNWTSGPYLHKTNDYKLPPNYILSKSHCGGYCMDCQPSQYVFSTAEDFELACRTGTSSNATVTYDASIPRKAVHSIRNPFDNLVARMHLAIKRSKKLLGRKDDTTKANLEYSSNGFKEWCQYLDTKHAIDEEAVPMLKRYSDLPCRVEWYRYARWHQLAFEATALEMELPVYYLYFENYTVAWNATVSNLLEFLQVDGGTRLGEPVPFVPGKTYESYYTAKQALRAMELVKELASPQVWKLLQHYFAPWANDAAAPAATKDLSHRLPVTEIGKQKELTLGLKANHNNRGKIPTAEVAWFLSFPNSVRTCTGFTATSQ